MYETVIYDDAGERAWAAASGLAVLMLVASGLPLGDAIKEATPYAGELDGTQEPR